MGRISYSQLSMYSDCPLRWKLNYVDKVSMFEHNIHLIFGTAMHEVLQAYLEIMYYDSVENADKLPLEEMLRDKLIEQFKIAKQEDEKEPCTKEDLQEFFQDGCDIIDFFKKRRADYFSKRGYKLIGCEVPIDVDLKKNINNFTELGVQKCKKGSENEKYGSQKQKYFSWGKISPMRKILISINLT